MHNLRSAFSITKNVFAYLFKNPKLLIPELITTLISLVLFVAVAIALLDLEAIEALHIIALVLLLILGSILNGFAAHAVLLMVKATNEGNKPSLLAAFGGTLKKLHHLLPIMLLSTLGKFIIAIISGLMKGATRRRGGFVRRARQSKESILKRSFRMFIFLMLSIEAFERPKFRETFSKSKSLIKERFWLFASGVLVIKLASAIFALIPIIALAVIALVFETINIGIIIGFVLYIFLAGAIVLVAEVVYISQLYLWNEAWDKAVQENEKQGKAAPSIHDIEKPDLLKGVDDDALYSANDPGPHG